MTQQPPPASSSRTWVWALLLIALVAFRLPALLRPAGGDQHLYAYTAGRVLHGDMPYRDSWDQKPPGIFFVYAAAWAVWPDAHVIGVLDLAAAIATAWLLMRLGRQMFGGRAGEGAAVLYLLLADPGIQKLGGMYLRSQCETFIGLAVTAAIALTWRRRRNRLLEPGSGGPFETDTRFRFFLSGVLLAAVFWLKYNAAIFALPVALAALVPPTGTFQWRRALTTIGWMKLGALVSCLIVLIYFAAGGALTDLWLATITYNLRYAGETYTSTLHALTYPVAMPVLQARVDGLWFLGLLGALLLIVHQWKSRATVVTIAWLAAAVVSIAVNGARNSSATNWYAGLPQYFIQATPALALAAAAGLALAWRERRRARVMAIAAGLLVIAGAWRVGVEGAAPRLFGLPQAVANVADDLSYARGSMPRETYLARFDRGEGGKFSPLAIERLANRVNEVAPPGDRIYVFGFSGGGVLVKTARVSASRFFWSRPVVLEFEAARPGYGSAGLLADLTRNTPAVVALQKHDWGLAEATTPDSIQFFMNQPQLRAWLEAGYTLDYEDTAYAVWRRKT
jgi:hypothetical protein